MDHMALRHLAPLVALALLPGCFPGCSPGFIPRAGVVSQAESEQAQEAVLRFHVRLNKGEIDTIWNGAGEELRTAATREQFGMLLEAVNRKLGSEQYTMVKSSQVGTQPGGTFLTMGMETKFDRGTAQETFVFRVDGDVQLVGYHINSMDLILR